MADVRQYKIKVVTNPNFCGTDAGGIQFAHGEAIINEGVMVEWFREHNGYEVTEAVEGAKEVPEEAIKEESRKGGRKAKEVPEEAE